MTINFKKIAQAQTTISEVMQGRQKVNKTDGIFNITDFDIVSNTTGEAYAVCAISDTEFINGGFVLTKIFAAILEECGGNIDMARSEFAQSGGLRVKLKREKTRSGRDITTVEVL